MIISFPCKNLSIVSLLNNLSKTVIIILESYKFSANSIAVSHSFSSIYCGIFVNFDFSFSKNFKPNEFLLYLKAFLANFI